MTPPFAPIYEAAVALHGAASLEARLATPRSPDELAAMPDAFFLDQMSLRIFRDGFRPLVVTRRWPAFQRVFSGFDPVACASLPDEAIEAMLRNYGLLHDLPRLRSIRANAAAMRKLDGMGRWLAGWPAQRTVGLWAELVNRFEYLGGNSAPIFLRMIGKDTFILTDSVVRGLNRWGAFAGEARSTDDQAAIQQVFESWATETGRPFCHLSQTIALSLDP